jgi:putative toxin-antitoxin system antitoxin component (TIGR02293 family)
MEPLEERIIQVKLRAIDVFGNEAKALRWLDSVRAELYGQTPLSVIHTDEGFDEVMRMLGRIDHGIFA